MTKNRFSLALEASEAADPERFGPKSSNQALLGHAGLPTPGGFCLDADAYRHQLHHLGIGNALAAFANAGLRESRRLSNEIRLTLFKEPIAPAIGEEILERLAHLVTDRPGRIAVRSSALIEDRGGTSFAGQFESFLGLETEEDFQTAVRASWAALWSTRALRYMDGFGLSPASTAMAVLVQPLVEAVASGGGISKTADGRMSISATRGLGEVIAQGEVVPDRYDLDAEGRLIETVTGRMEHSVHCVRHDVSPSQRSVDQDDGGKPCLDVARVKELARYMRSAEELVGAPVEVEWAMDTTGIKMLQARPLRVAERTIPDAIWQRRPALRGHPGGVGWGAGRARVIHCECELGRVGHGDILVTRMAGPALSHVLPHVAGMVAELGGSTSHLASLARERGTPMVLGVPGATTTIPEDAHVAVDGVTGLVRWID